MDTVGVSRNKGWCGWHGQWNSLTDPFTSHCTKLIDDITLSASEQTAYMICQFILLFMSDGCS